MSENADQFDIVAWWRARYSDLVETITDAMDGKEVTTDDNREFPLSNGAKALVERIRRESEQVSHYRDPSSVSDEGFDAACLGHLPPDERD